MTPAVSGTGVSVTYGPNVALAPSDFVIPAGSITTLIGPNGSGKSTLLNVIAGLVEPTTGSVVMENDGRTRLSYVLQSTKVNEALPVTVAEVVAMGRYSRTGLLGRMNRDDRSAVQMAMKRMGIEDLASRHLTELSGGQRQRVFVAQGLAQQHDLLLLDEPLTGLDLPSARAIDDVIHDENSHGCTVIITTHDLAEAQAADWVVLLSGSVIAYGPPGEVLTQEHLSDRVWVSSCGRWTGVPGRPGPSSVGQPTSPRRATDPHRNGPFRLARIARVR